MLGLSLLRRHVAMRSPGPAASLQHAEIPLGLLEGGTRTTPCRLDPSEVLWPPARGRGGRAAGMRRQTHAGGGGDKIHMEREGGGGGGGEKREGAGRQATQKAPCSDLWTPRTTARFRCASHCSMGLSLCITYGHAPALVIARHGHLGPDLQFAVRFRVYFLKRAVLKVRSKNERGA